MTSALCVYGVVAFYFISYALTSHTGCWPSLPILCWEVHRLECSMLWESFFQFILAYTVYCYLLLAAGALLAYGIPRTSITRMGCSLYPFPYQTLSHCDDASGLTLRGSLATSGSGSSNGTRTTPPSSASLPASGASGSQNGSGNTYLYKFCFEYTPRHLSGL